METPYLVHAFCYQIVLDVKSNFVTLSAAHIVEFITFWKFQTWWITSLLAMTTWSHKLISLTSRQACY